jgi:small multidrug resistance pump
MVWIKLGGAILSEIVGTMSLRASDGLADPIWLIPLVVGFLGAFYLLTQVLEAGMPVGVAYGIWASSGVALIAILGVLIFSEPFTWLIGFGIVLIMAGVLTVEVGLHKAEAGRANGRAPAS